MTTRTTGRFWRALAPALLTLAWAPLLAQKVTTPKEQFGFEFGADYVLLNYSQLTDYWRKLDSESNRMSLVEIGKTEEGRPQWMAIITAPENFANLEEYRQIAKRLALGKDLDDETARTLASRGKAIVWIDGGLHATEVLGAQQLMETVYQLVSGEDEETLRILRDVIVLAVHANPDGMDLVSNWYMRNQDPQRRSLDGLPRLYQKYIGHDNNRDFYAATQAETKNMNRVMYREWHPQIMYNHHQTGPRGAVLFAPPFRDPFNHNIDPLVITGIEMVGAAMHNRFIAEGKYGAVMREAASYSTWWNGGLRTTAYFHNMIGILTETIGSPTPIQIPFVAERQVPSGDGPAPVEPQTWKFRQSVDYSVTANRAILDFASRRREQILYNVYRMARNSIERGSRDNWTHYPSRVLSARSIADVRKPENRDARGYILPSSQPDFPTATKFVNALIENGVEVMVAKEDFAVGDKRYPKGSYVISCAQAFRPHILDMFEPQDHPNDIPAPGAPPIPPYDNAGYTLAYQMGVEFDRILEGFDGPFTPVNDVLPAPPAAWKSVPRATGFILSHQQNDSAAAVNSLLAAGKSVFWLKEGQTDGGNSYPPGSIFVPNDRGVRDALRVAADRLGITVSEIGTQPRGERIAIHKPRIGLWDRYGGSMPSGWTRWILERFGFEFNLVFAPELDAGKLNEKFDVLVFVDGAIPANLSDAGGGPNRDNIPAEFHPMLGNISRRTLSSLRDFLDAGGTVVTIGSSTRLANHLGLPVKNHLVQKADDGSEAPLPSSKFFIPGSVLRVRIANWLPVAYGLPSHVDVMFDTSPVFAFKPEAQPEGMTAISWFDSPTPLRSGWALGQSYVLDGISMYQAPVGKGTLYAFGPEILFRAQPHGTFKLFFNALYLSRAGGE